MTGAVGATRGLPAKKVEPRITPWSLVSVFRGRRLLPALKPQAPWFGTSLGEWSDELDEAAKRAVAGDYFKTGEALVQRRRSDLPMNTEVRSLDRKNEGDE